MVKSGVDNDNRPAEDIAYKSLETENSGIKLHLAL
jgi:hypothetical protein